MQTTIQTGQAVQPSVLSTVERTVKNWRDELNRNLADWLAARNEWFSAFTQEEVTNGHVVAAHLYMVALTGALLLAGWLEGGAL